MMSSSAKPGEQGPHMVCVSLSSTNAWKIVNAPNTVIQDIERRITGRETATVGPVFGHFVFYIFNITHYICTTTHCALTKKSNIKQKNCR